MIILQLCKKTTNIIMKDLKDFFDESLKGDTKYKMEKLIKSANEVIESYSNDDGMNWPDLFINDFFTGITDNFEEQYLNKAILDFVDKNRNKLKS